MTTTTHKAPAASKSDNSKKSSGKTIHFLIHDDVDNVGVAVVDLKAGDKAHGVSLESRKSVEIESKMDIPLGHKIALKDIAAGETLMKYGVDVGKFVASVKKGEHVHVHNVKTKRW
jgi:(2R)-sulfolactate sulfo-lyase subunit alpha